jgi:hypothetical protein
MRVAPGLDHDRWLAAVSAAQLAVGAGGLAVALRRGHAYDLPLLHGAPTTIARDAVLMGTALSAPVVMLAAHGVAVTRLLHGSAAGERRVLGGLGAVMVAGYAGESLVRQRLRPSGFDAVESPLVAIGIGLSAAMAVLGLSSPGR